MVQIKCHKCGRMHRKHTSIELVFLDGNYYWKGDGVPGKVVEVGGTCFEKIQKLDFKELKANY